MSPHTPDLDDIGSAFVIEPHGPVAWLRTNRPDVPGLFDGRHLTALHDAVGEVDADPAARVGAERSRS